MQRPSEPLHFTTGNSKLALALRKAGVPLLDITNVYTESHLESLGITLKQVRERNRPGKVTYIFDRTANLNELLRAFDEESKRVAAGQTGELGDATAVDVVRIVCSVLTERAAFAEFWKQVEPLLIVPADGEITRTDNEDDSYTMKHPGFKLISANASEQIRKDMGFEN